jgi:NAD(P)-dependent dehydrogenase (short-subunit alcohol dehydrogenase family)
MMTEGQNTQKVAILAARSTIGQAVTRQLQGNGHQVALLGRDLSGLVIDDSSFSKTCDLADFDDVENSLGEAKEAFSGLTGVVNCAGSMSLKPAYLMNRKDFDEAIEANLASAFAAVRASVKHLGKTGGSVVLISSAAAKLGMHNHELVSAAKAGIEGLVRSAAATYASRSLRFNGVAPGLVKTRLSENLVNNPASLKISESLHPLGRIGMPDEVANAICWLLDPKQSWVTGQIIGLDGGLSCVQPRPKSVSLKR